MSKKIFSLLLCLLLISALVLSSCGEGKNNETKPTGNNPSTPSGETGGSEDDGPKPFEYPTDLDLKGDTFNILNFEECVSSYVHLDFEEMTGDSLDDAVYNRNRLAESKLNMKFVEEVITDTSWPGMFTTLSDALINDVIADDGAYDASYQMFNKRIETVTGGYLYDLNSLDGFDFDSPWWDTLLIRSVEIQGKVWGATGSLNLMPFDNQPCTFFNKDMITTYNLENPYKLRDEGKWTLDKWIEMADAVHNLNGDEDWTFRADGKAIYGTSIHTGFPQNTLYNNGYQLIVRDGDSFKVETAQDDQFYTALDKLAIIFNKATGMAGGVNSETEPEGYVPLFAAGRALFLTSPLKSGVLMRDAEINFGLMPGAKISEEQATFTCEASSMSMPVCIPISNKNPDQTARVLEAMTHASDETVMPVYFDKYVSYKGLRDEDSLKTLEIFKSNRSVNPGKMYAFSAPVETAINNAVLANNGSYASTLKAQEQPVNSQIQQFMDALFEND